ncbi:hypothetical protein MPTK1_4g05060 [Marchantia polymorpha subsp. ruderalis]|uniref:DUF7798 domain-containing protein n=2 Tax=Marchantia polymorpha TaxID=3197 RepID=A0A176WKM9_MARPO|nr:hypothetical protein AXG93_2651s1210 [Marchantia polymorpha subsp. ruderalis]PTQ33655.1 hypothetical protein MARPO_0087s0083 [Marchantia polymorpha]BBN07617.1 hypothetical protein Mp_4g05060 [Marchantia polymorpha subsp. ruderalis]|eukprot:PTQ33655.1 hypothetical protein MARPO_0087s0083 [Marchantia polymorpha]
MEDGVQEQEISAEPATTPTAGASRAKEKSTGGGGGWGGWGTSALSVFSDLQKVAADVAGEISKNAVAAAKGAAKGVADLQQSVVNSIDEEFKDSQSDTEEEIKVKEPEPLSAEDIKRKAALDKLQEASKDSLLGQGLKAFDESVETIASGALAALGNAWKGSVTLVQKLEHSAENLAGTIQQGGLTAKAGSLAPSIIEGSKALTARGFKVLEYVGKETLDMLAAEAGIDFDNDLASSKEGAGAASETYNEDVSFDHCFIIYGGPEHLEELESLANHYTLLCNRARAKLVGEAKINFDTTLKQLQPVLTLDDDTDEGSVKGKRVEAGYSFSENEVKALQESSISKAAEMTTGFTAALGGLAMKEVVKKTSDRLEAIRAEGVHRISELCAVCLSHLLLLGKSVLTSTSDKSDKSDDVEDLDWPEDCIGKASLISARARAMAGDIKAVSDSFVTGIGDVTAAFDAALKNERRVADEQGEALRERELKEGTLEDRAQAVRSGIESDGAAAIEKIQDGLQHLTYVVLSTSFAV